MNEQHAPKRLLVVLWAAVALVGLGVRFYLAWETPLNEDELRNWVGVARLGADCTLWPVLLYTTVNSALYYYGAALYWLLGPRDDLMWLLRLAWVLSLIPAGWALKRIADLLLGRGSGWAALAVGSGFSYLLWKTVEARQVIPALVLGLIGLWLAAQTYAGERPDTPRRFGLIGLVLGTALFHHYDAGLIGLALGLYEITLLLRGRRSFGAFAARIACLAAGSLAAFMVGPLSYGFPHGTRLMLHAMFVSGLSYVTSAPLQVPEVFDTAWYDFVAWAAAAVGLIWFWYAARGRRDLPGAGLLLIFTLLSPLQIFGRTEVWEHTFITPMLAASLWAGWLLTRLARSWIGALASLALLTTICLCGPRLIMERLGEVEFANGKYHQQIQESFSPGMRGPFTLNQLRDLTEPERGAQASPFSFFVPYSKADQQAVVGWSLETFGTDARAWDSTGYAPYLRPPLHYQHSFYMNTVQYVDLCMSVAARRLLQPQVGLPCSDRLRALGEDPGGEALMRAELELFPPDLVIYDRYAENLLNAWPTVADFLARDYRYYVLPGPDFFVGVRADNDPFDGRSP
ncbi:MAG: hypothetical protein P9M14_08165 [Candidatus Alcyoniella australis]|nr:hypothetical protein [Candidatus Alcyoniella australis]